MDIVRKLIITGVALAASLIFTAVAYAHGVIINYSVTETGQIELTAEFDTGEVMSDANVTVYAPDDLANPWLTGTADEAGRFVFTVDAALPGTWDVQFRKAGHGDIVHIPIEAVAIEDTDETTSPIKESVPDAAAQPETGQQRVVVSSSAGSSAAGFSPIQVMLMSASVIWGFVGTALYFSTK